MAEEATYLVSIGGLNITPRLLGIVTQITTHDGAGQTSDSASLELDDTGGRIKMPQKGEPISIALGWVHKGGARRVFEGVIDEPRSTGGRGQGRMISISAKSADPRSKIKQHGERHWDDTTLGSVIQEAGQAAGITVSVHPSLASIRRDYWAMAGQSFAAFGDRLAREVGATFKIRGNRAVMVPRNQGIGAGGAELLGVRAMWGDNLISWDITPSIGRPQFKAFWVRWFDVKTGKWKREKVQAESSVDPESTGRYSEADADTSQRRAGSDQKGGDREKGSGTVTIDGAPEAQAEASVLVSGIRPGVDGVYRAESVEHNYVRGGGFTTTIELKQPSGEAGTDSRGSGGKPSLTSPNNSAGDVGGGNVA